MAILEMRLQRLAGLESKKVEDELKAVQVLIKELQSHSRKRQKNKRHDQERVAEIEEKFGDERRTRIVKHGAKVISDEELMPEVENTLVLTHGGYIKRTDPEEYRKQKRGGVGVVDLDTKEEDFVTQAISRVDAQRSAVLHRPRQSLPDQNVRNSGRPSRHSRQVSHELSSPYCLR